MSEIASDDEPGSRGWYVSSLSRFIFSMGSMDAHMRLIFWFTIERVVMRSIGTRQWW